MGIVKEEDIKVRLPTGLKTALSRIADSRFTSISEIAREALLAYVQEHGVTHEQLREDIDAISPLPKPPPKAAHYGKKK